MQNFPELQNLPKHMCACYAASRDRSVLVQHFLSQGVLRGEQVLCIVPDPDVASERFLNACAAEGVSPSKAPQVVFHRAESIYVPHGVFDPDRVLSLLVSCVQSALEIGFTGVRVVSDALWLLEHPLGAHQVVEYEHRVNRVAAGMPCSLLCLYPGKALPKAFLAYVFLTHPYVVRKGRCFWNPRYEDFDVLMETRFQAATYDTFVKGLVPVNIEPLTGR